MQMKPQATKLTIQSSFRRLLIAKPLDRITVRDIVEDCDLTRNTFYYHYEDIYDLFDDYLDTRMQQVLEELPPDTRWCIALQKTLGVVIETPQMGRHIFLSRKRDTLRQYLHRVIVTTVDRYIDRRTHGLTCAIGDRRLISATCANALYGLLEEWLVGPEAAQLEKNLQRVLELFEGAIRAALEKSAGSKEECSE